MKNKKENEPPAFNKEQYFAEGISLQQFTNELLKLDDVNRQKLLDFIKEINEKSDVKQ